MFPSFSILRNVIICRMRSLLCVILFCITAIEADAQLMNPRVWDSPGPMMNFEVNEYIYNHFEIGGGGQVLIILPGIHAKLRYAPINYQRIKLIAEVRGEAVTAPIAGWNYHIKAGTSFQNGVGIHAGFGRSHYVWRVRNYPNDFEVRNVFQNTFELGVRWESFRRQWDIWASLPLYRQHVPVFTVGVSVTAGGLWDFKDQKWFPPEKNR